MVKMDYDRGNRCDRMSNCDTTCSRTSALIAGIVIAAFCVFVAIVLAFAAVVMAGVVLFAAGIGCMIANPGVGLAVLGAGLMAVAIGVIGTVVGVRLCIIVFPGIVRGIVYILRKPFHRKVVA